MQGKVEQRDFLDRAVFWLGLGVASIVGLMAYWMVVRPLEKGGEKEAPASEVGDVVKREGFVIDVEKVIAVAQAQVTYERSVVVFAKGTVVFIQEPTADPVALAKAALVFEAERKASPVVTFSKGQSALVTHGESVATFFFEEDLQGSFPEWQVLQNGEEEKREKFLREKAEENLLQEGLNPEVVRILKAKPKQKVEPKLESNAIAS